MSEPDESLPPVFTVGEFTADGNTLSLQRGTDSISLEPRAFGVLRYLAQRPQELVTIDELMDALWAGAVVTPNAVTRVIAQLRKALGDDARQPRYLQTIPRTGYRLVAEVGGATSQRTPRRDWLVAAAAVLLAVAVAVWWQGQPRDSGVAVLPFIDYSGDASLDYLGEGVAEAVTSSLARVPELKVAARSHSFHVAANVADLDSRARELGVAYLVEGSVRKSGQRLRISAQLIEAGSGVQLWSDSSEHGPLELFEAQDAIAMSVATALVDELGLDAAAVPSNSDYKPDPRAYQLYLRGRYTWHRRGNVPYAPAVEALAEAVAIDPEFAQGWAALASAYLSWPSYSPQGYATWSLARDAALKALELDPDIPEIYGVLGTFAQYDGDLTGAHELYREGIVRNSRSATAHYWYSEHLAFTGRLAEAVRHVRVAQELDPTYLPPLVDTGFLYLMFGDFERGAQSIERAWNAGLRNPVIWMALFSARLIQRDFEKAREHVGSAPMPEDARVLLDRYVDVRAGIADRDALVQDLFATDVGMSYQLRTVLGVRLGAYEEVLAMLWQRRSQKKYIDLRPLWGPPADLVAQPGFLELAAELGLVNYWDQIAWGDLCRPVANEITCDTTNLTPGRLATIIADTTTDIP